MTWCLKLLRFPTVSGFHQEKTCRNSDRKVVGRRGKKPWYQQVCRTNRTVKPTIHMIFDHPKKPEIFTKITTKTSKVQTKKQPNQTTKVIKQKVQTKNWLKNISNKKTASSKIADIVGFGDLIDATDETGNTALIYASAKAVVWSWGLKRCIYSKTCWRFSLISEDLWCDLYDLWRLMMWFIWFMKIHDVNFFYDFWSIMMWFLWLLYWFVMISGAILSYFVEQLHGIYIFLQIWLD